VYAEVVKNLKRRELIVDRWDKNGIVRQIPHSGRADLTPEFGLRWNPEELVHRPEEFDFRSRENRFGIFVGEVCSSQDPVLTMTTTICGLFRGTSTVLQLWTESWETAFENKINLVGGGEITGHLLDAAMASIASNVIVAEGLYPSKLIKLVTFGHSRTGDQNFAAAHDRLVNIEFNTYFILECFHVFFWVWYDNDMALGEPFKVCLTPDNGFCSDSDFFNGSTEDHLHYFERALTWWGKDGCHWCPSSQSCVRTWGVHCWFKRLSDKAHCPVDKKPEFCYNDTFARSIMLPLSSAAYSTTPQRCLANAIRGTQLKRQITVPCSEKSKSDYCSGFTAISHADKAISISFRGTVTSWQLLLEGVETVSSYFYKAFFAIWDAGMMSDLAELIANNDGYELWITGHSLGGAIATIAANWIAFEKIVPATKIKLITFGEPRVGDYEYASIHDSMLPYSYRVTHKADLVPHLPMKHLNGYRHHGDEVWYNNDMTNGSEYQQCRMHETDGCSNSKMIDTSISDHLHYFGVHISGYGMRASTE
ncbi:unnamed protein product, partial [Toxocara canis]|uniref:Lipase_3 domain-containing protein n=1 Tax=Toxocara canis TaxID=6265 RepID=A0A183UIH5_TOXCA